MAERAHVKDGKVLCSACAAVIESDTSLCRECGQTLAGDFEAMLCPYCAAVLKQFSGECSNCGLRFKAVKKPVAPRSVEDEEFLRKLLDWGKKMQSDEVETEEDVQQKEVAQQVMRTVVGTREPTPLQKETLKEIEKTAHEKEAFERREESILAIAEPLEAALRARHQSLLEAEGELAGVERQLDELNARADPTASSKRKELQKRRAHIAREKGEIELLETRLVEMDETYKKLLAGHKRELDEKESSLRQRLDAFKQEMERREEEKRRLEKKEAILQTREGELAARLDRLKERERELDAREAELQKSLSALKAERDALAAGKPGSMPGGVEGRWMVDPAEVESVFKKSKKAREDWLEEQRKVQQSISATRKAAAPSDGRKVEADALVPKLNGRISELEAKIASLEKERKRVVAEEAKLGAVDEELKKVLKAVDELLGNLPDDVVDTFAKSEEFKLYNKVMDRYLGEGE
jgi:chromosome segregation ATPase